MKHRVFGRTGWKVGEVGYGMWGMGGWTGSDDEESLRSLHRAVELGVNFFDTAWAYGEGHSERLLGGLLRAHSDQKLYVATKIPPRNRRWPSRRGDDIADVFPPDYIREYVQRSLKNLGTDRIDLMQFHVWEDAWAHIDEWQEATQALTQEGLVDAWGISVNRWEPWNGLDTIRTGLVDAVQVIYNIFDQAPEDELFPLCREMNVGVIARVPFDEGTLTGTLTKDATWPEGDWRNIYFVRENLVASVERAEALKPLVPDGMTMAEMALRFILSNDDVSVVIPGMRKLKNVEANTSASDGAGLVPDLLEELKAHRWDRQPTDWSQ
ncbi:MAG: aldo/keto reductase [Actinomycetota bacterium]|nr:aldo/keto reductase [Actinomycetota bacterium]